MSTRALRKLQREQEELRAPEVESEDEDDELLRRAPKKGAFDLLNAVSGDEEGEAEDLDEHAAAVDKGELEVEETGGTQTNKKPKKKKKRKGKSKAVPAITESSAPGSSVDKIDLALQSLRTSDGTKGKPAQDSRMSHDLRKFYSLLAVDRKNLNALNEMKKLFGSVVLENEDEGAQRRRQQRGPQQVDLAQAISARYNRGSQGQGLSGLALRQNVLMAGKPEWPKAASGGLGMDLVERFDDFTTEYRFVHNNQYQATQRLFEKAVQTMDPNSMIEMVIKHPYHIASILQLAEVCKHQGDHSVAGELYERALYNFGRSVQSTFATALAEGKARMDFRRPENREFWLTVWRYIGSLTQRGTFRTAYEWAKLLLSLDPEGDPYRVRLVLDQLALRGGQAQHLIDLASTTPSVVDWGQGAPNIRISVALAHQRLKQIEEAKDTLLWAVRDYPWVFAQLFQQLDLDKAPKSIWATEPRNSFEQFETESYALRGKEIWNTPDSLTFLREVIESAPKSTPPKPNTSRQISLDEARHAILSDIPALISTLPREFTTMQTTSSDPLPPPDDMPSYSTTTDSDDVVGDSEDEIDVGRGPPRAAGSDGIVGWLTAAINAFRGAAGGDSRATEEEIQVLEGELERAQQVQQSGRRRGRGTPTAAGAAGTEQSLGVQMGMEEVVVRTPQEYEAALVHGRWPVVPEDARDAFNAALQAQRGQGEQGLAEILESPDDAQQGMTVIGSTAVERPGTSPVARPMQATVEDEDDEPATVPRAPEPEPYDDQANKRWLAGRGMLALKDFVAEHGTDESTWLGNAQIDKTPAMEYVKRLPLLKQRSDRNFILDYALKQGAGATTSEMIRRLVIANKGSI